MTTTFDPTTPTGAEAMSTVDDRIRELKLAIQDALRGGAAEGTEAVFPGAAPLTAPIYRYRGLMGSTAARPAAGQSGLYFNTTKNTIERDNGSSWDVVGTNFPSGTVLSFFQASPPVGWTQVTTHNDKALRVVSGAGGGSGGVDALSSPPSLSHTHTVTIAFDGVHSHNLHAHAGAGSGAGASSIGYSAAQNGDLMMAIGAGGFTDVITLDRYTEASSAHAHVGSSIGTANPPAFTPKYIDMIIASKD